MKRKFKWERDVSKLLCLHQDAGAYPISSGQRQGNTLNGWPVHHRVTVIHTAYTSNAQKVLRQTLENVCVSAVELLSQTLLFPALINDPHRSHLSSALFNTLIILHLLGKLDFYETRSSVFEFNWNAVTSGCNMRRGTCYSIHPTMLNLWHTIVLKHWVRKSRVPFVGHPSKKNLEMSKDAYAKNMTLSACFLSNTLLYCLCAFLLFFPEQLISLLYVDCQADK